MHQSIKATINFSIHSSTCSESNIWKHEESTCFPIFLNFLIVDFLYPSRKNLPVFSISGQFNIQNDDAQSPSSLVSCLSYNVSSLTYLNPLMPGGNKKGHAYLNKPADLSMCEFLLPPGIKGLRKEILTDQQICKI